MKEASSEAKNATAAAMSCGLPSRPTGALAAMAALASAETPAISAVSTAPGRTALNLMPSCPPPSTLGRTGLFTLLTVPLTIAAGLLLAVLVNQPLRGRGMYRTLLYLPAVMPPVGAGLTFKLIFDRDSGSANGLLDLFGMNGVSWLTDPYARWVLIVLTTWGAGNLMIITLAGLQDVPKEVLEAARVDGANRWQSFTRITLPLLSPVLFFQVVTGIIAALQSFAPLFISLDVSPQGMASVPQDNYLFTIKIITEYFANSRYGYASALLWVLFAIILVLTLIVFKVSKGMVFYSVEPEPARKKPRTLGDKR